MKVFVPSADNEFLVSGGQNPEELRVTADFILASRDTMLSLRRTSTASSAKHDFYSALRLEEAVKVRGVNVLQSPLHSDQVVKKTTAMPEGSLLLRAFNKDAKGLREWYGLRPIEEAVQNMQRVECEVSEEGVSALSDARGFSTTHYDWFHGENLWGWRYSDQAFAHYNDFLLQKRLGLSVVPD